MEEGWGSGRRGWVGWCPLSPLLLWLMDIQTMRALFFFFFYPFSSSSMRRWMKAKMLNCWYLYALRRLSHASSNPVDTCPSWWAGFTTRVLDVKPCFEWNTKEWSIVWMMLHYCFTGHELRDIHTIEIYYPVRNQFSGITRISGTKWNENRDVIWIMTVCTNYIL